MAISFINQSAASPKPGLNWRAILAIVLTLLVSERLQGRVMGQAPDVSTNGAQTPNSCVALPKTVGEIDAAIGRVEARLNELRLKVAAFKTTDSAVTFALAATPDEITARDVSLQQWVIALDQQGRYLRGLKETRRLNEERAAKQESWHGFAQRPTMATTEQLTDTISAQRLQLRTAQMLLPILEGELARYTARLNSDRKQLRLANDQAEHAEAQTARRVWMVQLAQWRKDADEASIESAELGRRVAWEAVDGQQRHTEFLERKLAAARAEARMTKSDLEGVLAQIAEKRAVLQMDLNEAIAADKELRTSRDAAVAKARTALDGTAVTLHSAAEVEQARVETSGRKVESIRGFLQLADYARTVWEDRLWVTEPRTLRQLRAKQRHHHQLLEGLRQWKALMEQSLSAVSEQLLRQALRAEGPSLTLTERDSAKAIQAALQERALVELRTVGALAFTEDLTARLHAELSEQVTRISFAGKLDSVFEDISVILHRIWNAELYIAEDSVIAGGQKVSIGTRHAISPTRTCQRYPSRPRQIALS